MNAVVYVTTSTGKVNVYRDQTMMAALSQFFAAMDDVNAEASSIKEVALYTRFQVNTSDSKVYDLLESRGLASALK